MGGYFEYKIYTRSPGGRYPDKVVPRVIDLIRSSRDCKRRVDILSWDLREGEPVFLRRMPRAGEDPAEGKPVERFGGILRGRLGHCAGAAFSVFPRCPNKGMGAWSVITIQSAMPTPPIGRQEVANNRFFKGFVGWFVRGLDPVYFQAGYGENEENPPTRLEDLRAGYPRRSIPFLGYFPPAVVGAHSARFWARFEEMVLNPRDLGAKGSRRLGRPWVQRLPSGGIYYRLADLETGARDRRLRELIRSELGVPKGGSPRWGE